MKKVLLIWLTILLSNCASTHYGNFTPMSQGQDAYLAAEAITQIHRIYPPAQNTFCISQKTVDGFGMHLIQGLRKSGYGLNENECPKHSGNFFYVLDEVKPKKLYRLSIFVNTQMLSRIYAKNQEKLVPVSPWSHKE